MAGRVAVSRLDRRNILGLFSAFFATAPAGAVAAISKDRRGVEASEPTALRPGKVASDVLTIRTAGYASAGDGGSALYRRVAIQPRHAGKFRSDDGAWWTLTEDVPTVAMFGAVGDGVSDDAPAIQGAIDWTITRGGGTVLVPRGRFLLRHSPARDGLGVSALTLRSGVTLRGTSRHTSVLVLADGQIGPGTFARMIASDGPIVDAELVDLTIDANRAGQGSAADEYNGAAVLLGESSHGDSARLTIRGCNILGANGQGIQIAGRSSRPTRDIRVCDNLIRDASFIGVQVAQFDELLISGNRVESCRNNGIDIYGDNDEAPSNTPTGRRAIITGNSISRASIGIFLETVADVVASSNIVDHCRDEGVHINRIHGAPGRLLLTGNGVSDTSVCVGVTGDAASVTLVANSFSGFSLAGIRLGAGGASYVSNIVATNNGFSATSPRVPFVLADGPSGQLAYIRIVDNHYFAAHDVNRFFVSNYVRTNNVIVGGFGGAQEINEADVKDGFADFDRLRLSGAPPKSATASGRAGALAVDDTYVYVCVAPDRWKRAALSSW